MNCNICAEKFNKTSRLCIKCICNFECCRGCIKRYMLDKKEDAHCMECKVVWNREFITNNFEKTFVNKDYKQHREEVLLDKEMGMLPATQPFVDRQIRLDKITEEEKRLREEFNKTMLILSIERNSLIHGEVEKRKFVRKCPNGTCQGYLSSALKCAICECFACGECREVKGYTTEEKEAHECNKEILESIKMLEKDSKPCPKCSSMTFKIIGCNQIFCVECHTAWDWKTGNIDTGTIHNPHYFEWQRQQHGTIPRNPNDILCGREIDNNFTSILISRGISKVYCDISREIIHIRFAEQPRFQPREMLHENLEMRIDYMRNKIDKETMKKKLQEKEKKNQKHTELYQIIVMYVNCMTDIMYRLVEANESKKTDWKKEFNTLRVYTNGCFEKVSKSYNCKKYEINDKFEFK